MLETPIDLWTRAARVYPQKSTECSYGQLSVVWGSCLNCPCVSIRYMILAGFSLKVLIHDPENGGKDLWQAQITE